MTTQHSQASPASLNFIPTCVSVSKSGRQEGRAAAHRQRAGVTVLSTAEQQLQKKKVKERKEGDSWVTGVHHAFRKRLTARGLGQKRRALVCYWKS